MLQAIIAHSTQKLHQFFNPERIHAAARTSGFVQRTSKLDGYIFLKALVLGFVQHPRASLAQLTQTCLDLGVAISPQGLDERLNEAAIEFLREALTQALASLQARRPAWIEALKGFSEVYFQDSTIQSLPAALQGWYAGSGGNASVAAVKIQLLFAFMSGNLAHIELTPGRTPDSSYQGHLPQLLPGSLLVQDLGFFNLGFLHSLAERGAFFLTRWRQDVALFWSARAQAPVEMQSLLKQQTSEVAEYRLWAGLHQRLPCRMLAVRLPHRVAAQRRRRLCADGLRRGTTPSQRALDLCDWNIFLTNLPPERLSLPQLLACYTLRWQIELIFKLWKSQAGLKHLAGRRRERVLCELYAKMIALVLTHFLVAPLRFKLLDQQLEISLPKAHLIVQDRAKSWIGLSGVDMHALQPEVEELVKRILRFARKNKRKKHLSSLDKLICADHLSIAQLYPLA